MANTLTKTIMIIDDSEDNLSLLGLLFTAQGYQIVCAANGQAALEVLHSLKSKPDLIFLDVQMPVMDGNEFRKAQLVDPTLKNIPVVMMTAGEWTELPQVSEDGAEVLTKPLTLSKILNSVARYL